MDKKIFGWVAAFGFIFCLIVAGCTSAQQAKLDKVENEVKTGVKIADESLNAFNAVIQTAAPNSSLAKQTASATVTAQKVNGVVQTVTIVVPIANTVTATSTSTSTSTSTQ